MLKWLIDLRVKPLLTLHQLNDKTFKWGTDTKKWSINENPNK